MAPSLEIQNAVIALAQAIGLRHGDSVRINVETGSGGIIYRDNTRAAIKTTIPAVLATRYPFPAFLVPRSPYTADKGFEGGEMFLYINMN